MNDRCQINLIKRKVRYFHCFLAATLVGLFVLGTSVFVNIFYIKEQQEVITRNQHNIENLLKDNKKNKNSLAIQEKSYEINRDYMVNYYTVQSNWLNSWLAALAVIMAVFGIMIPICFVKFLENKEKEMDLIINNAKQQADTAQINVETMEKQLIEVNKKSEQMKNDLNEVKDYVATVKAESLYVDAVNKVNDKNYDDAIEILYKAKNIKDNDKIHYLLGECFRHKNKLKKAIQEYTIAIEFNKEEVKYFCKNAACLSRVGEHKKALANINNAIKLDSNNKKLQLDRCVAQVLSDKNQYKQSAQATVDNLIGKFQNNAFVLNTIGFLLIKIDNLKQAETVLLESINKDKHPYYQYYNLTKIYVKSNKFSDAKSTLKQYLAEDSKRENRGIFDDDYNEWNDILTSIEQRIETKDLLEVLKTVKVRKRSGDDE